MQNKTDIFLLQMLQLTKKLCAALAEGDLDESGRILARRGELIAGAPAPAGTGAAGFSAALNNGQRTVAGEILTLDEEAHRLAETLGGEIQKKMTDSTKMKNGLLRYQKTQFNLQSGQIVDKTR
ncbi:MAG: hypothetical protein P4L75_06725 [Clostridia bacterium]|nr:hypothetical protein [Clostridia bacterium]